MKIVVKTTRMPFEAETFLESDNESENHKRHQYYILQSCGLRDIALMLIKYHGKDTSTSSTS